MDPKNILVLGVKGSVVTFRRDTGAQLWTKPLKSGQFVTVTADEKRIYAHTNGELFCLDLQTGAGLWQSGLPGLGYGTASLALPGVVVTADAVFEKLRQDAAAADAATHTNTTSH